MSDYCLSEKNIRRLKELGYGCVANSIELHPISNGSRYKQARSRGQREDVAMLRRAIGTVKDSSDAIALHDAVLKVFACIYLHFSSTTTIVLPQSQSNLDESTDTEYVEWLNGGEQSRQVVDKSLMAQQDLIQLLVSATLCNLDSTDEPVDVFIAEAALASVLLLQYTTDSVRLPTRTLAHIAAHTNLHNNWTTKPAAFFAKQILDLQLARNDPRHLITGMLAIDISRPRLQESFNSDSSESSVINVPTSTSLRYTDNGQRFATVFEWALQKAETEYVAGHWHLIFPFLINNLTESHEITARTKALQLVIIFLTKCPATTLVTTGIDCLLENAIFPLLHFVPPSTLGNDSTILLATAYQALTDLAVKKSTLEGRSKRRLLDKLIREGVLQSCEHAFEYVDATTVLLNSTAKVASFLGIFATKHLSSMLGLIESVMCNSFFLEHPTLLKAASEAFAMVIFNCWPRMRTAQRLEQVLRILSVCWLNLHELMGEDPRTLEHPDRMDMARGIREVVFTMRSMLKDDTDWIIQKLEMICVQDRRLENLFMTSDGFDIYIHRL